MTMTYLFSPHNHDDGLGAGGKARIGGVESYIQPATSPTHLPGQCILDCQTDLSSNLKLESTNTTHIHYLILDEIDMVYRNLSKCRGRWQLYP